jgi:DNA polymerase-3 subunit delta
MAVTSSSFSSFIVSFGDEDFYLDRDIERARQGKRSVIQVNAEEGLSDIELVNLCESYSELPRTIIVDNAQKVKGNKDLREFIENHNEADRSLILVAIVRGIKLSEVWELVASKGKKVERKKFKPWEVDAYTNFIKTEATRLRVAIDQTVASLLFKYVGTDLYRLENELRKLAIFVGQAGTIKKEHIALVTSPTPQVEPFQVAEQVLKKDPKQALNLFSILYKNLEDDSLIPVVRALMNQVERTLIIRSLLDKGVSDVDIAISVGIKDWIYKNIAAPIARKHDLKSLVGYMGRLCKLDADVKGPARSKRTLVELTMLSIAQ